MEILRNDSKAAPIFSIAFTNDTKKLPEFEFSNLAGDFPAAYLFIKRVEELLSGCRACIGRAVMQRSTEAAEVKQALRCSVEHHSHTVKKVDDARCSITHCLDERLVCEEVTAIAGVIKVDGRRVAFTLGVHCTVDTALCTDRVGSFHWDERKHVHGSTGFSYLDRGHQTRQAAADNDCMCFCRSCHD